MKIQKNVTSLPTYLLNMSKAAGPDGIHARVIIECIDIFSDIFYLLFSKSLNAYTYYLLII